MDFVSLGLTIALKLLGWWIDKSSADDKVKASFLAFIGTLEERQLVSVKVSESFQKQMERLKDGNKQ